jgi:hypothetical protein
VYIDIAEGVSTNGGGIGFSLEEGVSVTSQTLSSGGDFNGYAKHEFTFNGQNNIEKKIGTITLNSVNDDLSSVSYIAPSSAPYNNWLRNDNRTGIRLEYSEFPLINSSNEEYIATAIGNVPVKKTFTLYVTTKPNSNYAQSNGSQTPVSLSSHSSVILATINNTTMANASKFITNVTTNLGSLPNGSSNVIPSDGIQSGSPLVAKVYGTPGASFKVEFIETKVVEGVDTGRSTIEGAAEYFGGIIPDTPIGFVKVPESGVYSFSMPRVASFVTDGWKEFEMRVTAAIHTFIKPSTVKKGGKLHDNGAMGSIVANTFYQYPKVNIAFDTVTLPTGWAYTASVYDIISVPTFGGNVGNKFGIPNMPPLTSANMPSSASKIKFELRITETGGAFSLTPGNVLSASDFKALVRDNGDVVTFSNLKAHIGNGSGDTNNNFATITGTIRCERFGLGSQLYTLDLSDIFNFA